MTALLFVNHTQCIYIVAVQASEMG